SRTPATQHEMRFHARVAKLLEQANAVDRAGGAGDADYEAHAVGRVLFCRPADSFSLLSLAGLQGKNPPRTEISSWSCVQTPDIRLRHLRVMWSAGRSQRRNLLQLRPPESQPVGVCTGSASPGNRPRLRAIRHRRLRRPLWTDAGVLGG